MAAVAGMASSDALASVFEALARFVGSVRADAAVERWLWPSAVEVADNVLGATSLDDLNDRIEAAIEERGKELAAGLQQRTGGRQLSVAEIESVIEKLKADTDSGAARLTPMIGETAASRWKRGWLGIIELLEIVVLIKEAIGDQERRVSPEAETNSLDERMYAPGDALSYRRAMWKGYCAAVATLAIQRAYETKTKVAPWLSLAIVDVFADGFGGFLERLGVKRQPGFGSAFDPAVLAKWADEAAASGQPVYFPLGDVGDDR